MNIRQPALGAVVVIRELLMVQAQQVKDGGVEVVDIHHVFNRLVAEGIGGAEAESVLDARAGEPGGESLGVVIAALGSLLERGHAAELGGPDDQRIVEHAPRLEVDQQSAAARLDRESGRAGRNRT